VSVLSWMRSKWAPARKVVAGQVVGKNYAAAFQGDLTHAWTSTPLTSTETLRQHLTTIRARSREQMENNPHMRRYAQLLKNNVAGPLGIQMQARAVKADGTPDKLANDTLERHWKAWGHSVDMAGRLTWRDAQALFLDTVSTDGEALVQKFATSEGYGFQIALLDPQVLSVELNEDGKGGSRIVMGVELDKYDRPVAYHMPDTSSVVSTDYWYYYNRPYKRVPASQIIHAFRPERVDQVRGVPWAANALLRMNMLDGYSEAELIKARLEASQGQIIEQDPDAGEYVPDGWTADSEPVSELVPGIKEILPPGMRLSSFSPTSPNSDYNAFAKAMLRDISASLGVSYFTLANDLEGVNYTSSRTGLLEDREAWKGLQEWVIQHFCQPVYEEWLTYALAAGRLTIGDNGPSLWPDMRPKYKAVTWQGPRWQWVDPMKEVSAWAAKIEMGGGTVSQFLREQGFEPDEVFAERAAEIAKMEKLGISADRTEARSQLRTLLAMEGRDGA